MVDTESVRRLGGARGGRPFSDAIRTIDLGICMATHQGSRELRRRRRCVCARGQAPSGNIVEVLRRNCDNRFTPPGLGPRAPLTDIIVHGLDISVPIHRVIAVPCEASNAALDFLMTPRAGRAFVTRAHLTGLRFESTAGSWSAGNGPVVAGPSASLLLAITGRRSGLDAMTGDGADELRSRIT